MRPSRTSALLVVVVLLAVASAAVPWVALAADTSTIQGTVELGPKGGPQPGVKVSLNRGNLSTGEGEENIDSATTGPDGSFTFDAVDAGEQWQYDVTVDFKGVTYFSDAIDATGGGTARTQVTVYDTTDADKDIGVAQYTVYLDQDPSGGMAVEQDVTFVNGGDRTFTGKKMAPGAPALTAQLPVAPSANQDSIQSDGLFNLYEGGAIGTAYGTTAPIVPGINQTGTLRYVTVPTALTFPVSFPTKDFTLYVAPEIAATVSGLAPQGQQSLPGGGPSPVNITYSAYAASNLAPGQTIQVQTQAAGGTTPRLPAAAVFVLGLAIVIGLLLLVARLRTGAPLRGSRSRAGKGGPRKVTPAPRRTKSSRPHPPSAAERHATADDGPPVDDEEADLLIAEIAALDESFAQGLIAEDDYRRIRTARKDQLRRAGSEGQA